MWDTLCPSEAPAARPRTYEGAIEGQRTEDEATDRDGFGGGGRGAGMPGAPAEAMAAPAPALAAKASRRLAENAADAMAQGEAAEDQLKRAEALYKAMEQRRAQLSFSEKKLSGVETKMAELVQKSKV